jgi:hypothetical protein
MSHGYEASMNQHSSPNVALHGVRWAFDNSVLAAPNRNVRPQSHQQTSFSHSGQVSYLLPCFGAEGSRMSSFSDWVYVPNDIARIGLGLFYIRDPA